MVSMRKNKNGANFKSLYTANTVAALYSAQLGDSNELRLAAIGRYGDTPPYRYLREVKSFRQYSSYFFRKRRFTRGRFYRARASGGSLSKVPL